MLTTHDEEQSMSTEPAYLTAARRDIGLREIKGPKHAGRIVRMLQGLGAWWRDDETPWCGVAMAAWMSEAGYAYPTHYYRALAWAEWGRPLLGPWQGAVAVLTRTGGGHVGIVTGVTANGRRVRLLGGNQNDAVNEAWFPIERVTAFRAPPGVELGRAVVAPPGTMSKSEA